MFEWLAQTTTPSVTDGLAGPAWIVVAIAAIKVALDAVTKLIAARAEKDAAVSQAVDTDRCQDHGEAIVRLQEQYRNVLEMQRSIDKRLDSIEKLLRERTVA